MSEPVPLTDRFGRVHRNLRVSVTDRCNIRCSYCMPADVVQFKPRQEILRFEEIERFVRAVVPWGIHRIRITGGEPLVRRDVATLVRRLARVPGVDDLAMTTNGMLLDHYAAPLRRAGLQRLNISLDAIRAETFQRIARRTGLDRVMAGIDAARQVGFDKIRLNAVSLIGTTEEEVIPLAEFARSRDLELRFIEFMPLDAEGRWQPDGVLSGAAVRGLLEAHFGPLAPLPRDDPSQPAVDFAYADGTGRVGFINPVTEPFCGDCNRLRLSAEGQLRSCLFSTENWDVRALLRGGASDAAITDLTRACLMAKKAGRGTDDFEFVRPPHAMYQLGG
ncbi:MAG: GTP 3',8-cyclase MoaA [Pirellulaceae bacterium]|jgi:cyclic pyranopterin phosphate synthase|nr:GTP 3',8-cyclase MoaA [Pirellulaceae bacterium]